MSYLEDILRLRSFDLPWKQLSGKNILITGATGLIGASIVDVLMNVADSNFKLYALGRNRERALRRFKDYLEDPRFHLIILDVLDPLPIDVPFNYVIYAASGANPIVYASDPVGVIKTNICGLDNIFTYGLSHGLEKLVYISSGDAYGEGDGRIFTEDYSGYVDPINIRSCYSSSKRTSETLCACYSYQYDIDTIIARPCHVYGPYFTESDTRVFAQFVRCAVEGKDIVMKSSGSQIRSWCYVVDCASAILFLLLKGQNREAYNIADDNAILSIKELAEVVSEVSGVSVVYGQKSELEKRGFNPVSRSILDTTKIKELGWKPLTSIYDNLLNIYNELTL